MRCTLSASCTFILDGNKGGTAVFGLDVKGPELESNTLANGEG